MDSVVIEGIEKKKYIKEGGNGEKIVKTLPQRELLSVGVVGIGYWGPNLIRNFSAEGRVKLSAICDLDKKRMMKIGSQYSSAKQFTDFENLLNEVDAVAIATPAALHYAMAKQALLAGKDIFVEKPLSLKVDEGRELVELAREKGNILLVGHLLEYHPAVVKLKDLVDNGELGRIQYIYSNRLNLGRFRTEENILWSFAPHDISVILLLLG